VTAVTGGFDRDHHAQGDREQQVSEFDVRSEVVALGQELSNWGRWGSTDQRGAMNLVTPERIAAAAGLVRRGAVFPLGIPLDGDGPQPGGQRMNPVRLMSQTGHGQRLTGGFHFADDYVFMPLQAGTQWDALAHVYYGDQLWNGYPASDIGVGGAARNAIDRQAGGVIGRAVLLDAARWKGVVSMVAGEPITAGDLDAIEKSQGVSVGEGDILLVRTGWYGRYLQVRDRVEFMSAEPGLDLSCARWLHDRGVAAVACDNWGVEVFAGESAGRTLELHMVLIRDVGMTLGELFDLDALAADCAADRVWECLLAAPPLKFTGAVGSPVNPLAVK